MSASLQQALLAERVEAARALRERFTACLAAMEAGGWGAEAVATAVAKHLATTRADELPLEAQTIWVERIARPLKASATRPLGARAGSTIRSWPSARLNALVDALREIEVILAKAETDAMNEAIYAEISRAYS